MNITTSPQNHALQASSFDRETLRFRLYYCANNAINVPKLLSLVATVRPNLAWLRHERRDATRAAPWGISERPEKARFPPASNHNVFLHKSESRYRRAPLPFIVASTQITIQAFQFQRERYYPLLISCSSVVHRLSGGSDMITPHLLARTEPRSNNGAHNSARGAKDKMVRGAQPSELYSVVSMAPSASALYTSTRSAQLPRPRVEPSDVFNPSY